MNKARRQELRQLRYEKRLKRRGYWNEKTKACPRGEGYNFTSLKSTSAPCNCPMCRNAKHNRAKEKQDSLKILKEEYVENS